MSRLTGMQFNELNGREILEKRTANEKHFDLGQGRRQAVIFASPVHFRNAKTGTWEEIDNRLTEKVDAKGRRRLENKAGLFRARFFEDSDEGNLVSMKTDDTEFGWRYPGANVLRPVHTKKVLRRSFDSELSRRMRVTDRLNDNVTYESLFPGMSVRLTVDGMSVKEDIILETPEAIRHAVLALPSGYEYVKNADNSVSVLKDGKVKLTIDAPFTYDANMNDLPCAVSLHASENETLLSYQIPASNLENAVFPVTIDPRVSFSGTQDDIETTQICTRDRSANYSTSRNVTSGTSSTSPAYNYMTLVKFNGLMKKQASDTILSAELNMEVSGSKGLSGNPSAVEYVAAYEIKSDWQVDEATWNNMDADNHTVLGDKIISFIPSTNVTYAKFNITDLYNKWYLPDDEGNSRSFGVVLRKPIGISSNNYVTFYSSIVEGHKPFVVINYLSHAGVKDWWTYETMSCGRAGSAYVDLFNGNLVFHHADAATIGLRMPVSVKHVYNSCQSLSDDFGCGLGWRLALHQTVRLEEIASADYYIWQDGEGTDHFFEKTTSQPYTDCEGMQLKMNLTADGLTITDKGDTVLTFEAVSENTFRLTTVADARGNRMLLEYNDAGKLEKVKDGIDKETVFAYDGNGLLSSVSAPGCPVVQYVYAPVSGGYNLHKVIYADLPTAQNAINYTEYAYEGSMLTSMKNFDGCELAVSYEAVCASNLGDDYVLQSRRVKSIEYKNGAVKGAKKVFEYGHMRTDVTHMESETDGKKITYHFNSSGNVVDVNDEMWYTYGTKYDSGIENSPSAQGRVRRAVVNHLVNADFVSGWTQTKEYSSDTYSIDTANRCLTMRSAKMLKKGAGEMKSSAQARLFESGKYTFSAYIKTTGLTVTEGKKGAFLRVTDGVNVYESEAVKDDTTAREMSTFASGWERVYVTFPFTRPEGLAETTASLVTVSFVCDAKSGTAYFSAPQVEMGEIANMYNLLVNGDFSATKVNNDCPAGARLFPEQWTIIGEGLSYSTVLTLKTGVVTNRSENHMPASVEGNALRLHSYPSLGSIFIGQTVSAGGKKDDVFVIGGWANSNSVLAGHTASKPALRIRYQRTADSTWTDWTTVYFTTENGSWHHLTCTVAATAAYKQLQVAVSYPQNHETCMFSHIYLYRDLYGSSFTYDNNGNVVNVKDVSNLQSQAQYDNFNNLLSYVQPGSASTEKYTFTYGTTDAEKKRHLPLTATTPMGVKSLTTYDSHGNATENVIQPADGQPFMKTQTVYTNNGHYVASQKDARGNNVVNLLDANGKVLGVTDPAGNSVTYVYDASNRITGVTAEANDKIHKNSYTYENDRIKTISHNTTSDTENDVSYTFEYDDLGRKTKVNVGNVTLSENVYSADRKGLLEEMNFGNGAKIRYEYDAFGRTTAIYVDEPDPENEGSVIATTTPKYEFAYDARGIASVIKDNVLMTETRTTSDLADRPSESVTRDADGNLLHKSVLNYDGKNRVKEFVDVLPESTHKTAYTYDADNRVTEVKFDNSDTHKVNYTYDLLNRVTNKTVTNGTAYSTNYTYVAGDAATYGANATTPLVSTITQGSGANAMNFAYTYDSRGNITSETRNGVTVSYEYDELGQLTRVNDPNDPMAGASGTTWIYTYDRGGNILNKAAHAYTTGDISSAELQWPYTYGDSNWKDKLTGYKDRILSYDAIGNMKSNLREYSGDHYEWEAGRRLKELSGNGYSIEYKYDHNGIRTYKKWHLDWYPVTVNYTLRGKHISQMTVDYHDWDEIPHQDVLYFYYDAQGKPAKVSWNGEVYTYVHNLQGDIVGIVNSSGTLVVEYKYDAWGRPLSTSGSMAETLGRRNPFRYRGYVYDEESDLYYLRSRYYDPELGRFINSDYQYGTVAEHLSHNLFAYCANSPIMHVDLDGQVWVMGAYAPSYGYYHRKVVNWIKENNPSIIKEVFVGTGFIDLYNKDTYEMYEVKPNRPGAIAKGLLQLERYKAGTEPAEYGVTPLILPPDGALDESFLNTTVKVTVTQSGPMIIYSLKIERKKKSNATDPATVPILPIPEQNNSNATNSATVPLLPIHGRNNSTSSLGAPVAAACFATAMIFILGGGPMTDRRLR